jgi:hypothetical protein
MPNATPKHRAWIYLWAVAVFLASNLTARWLGIRFADNGIEFLYQFLDPEILRHDLLRGLYYLHAQPPLFNLFLGLVLKWFPGMTTGVFAVIYGTMALGMLLAMVWLMRRLDVPDPVVAIVSLFFAVLPNFMVYSHWVFYTLPVSLLVLGMAVFLVGYLDSGKQLLAHSFAWTGAVLMLTRALYHPFWFVAVVVGVALLVSGEKRKVILVSAIAPLIVVNLWYLKNYLQVESYSGSSWLGMNLAKRWPLSQKEMAALREDGKLPPVWHRRPFKEPDELRYLGYFEPGPPLHPALDEPYKSNGEPNFNHRDYAEISREMLQADLFLVFHYPGRFLRRSATAFLLYLQPGPNAVGFLVDYDFSRIHRLRDAMTRIVFRGGPIERPIRMLEPPVNVWLLGFPALFAFGLYRVFRGKPEERPLFAYIVITVFWLTVTTNLIEIGENDRMRWEVEPLLTVLLAVAIAATLRRAHFFRGG